MALHIELLVETFARKIAALAIDAAAQKGRADALERQVERLRAEYEPGYPMAHQVLLHAAPAEMPAPTCECDKPSINGDGTCGKCWRSTRAPVASDASVDGYKHTRRRLHDAEEEIDRLRAEFAAANEKIARLKAQAEETSKSLTVMDVIAQERDDAQTKMGRAVSALRNHARAWGTRESIAEVDAILADADCTQAAAAWLGLLAAYASHNQRGEDGPCECDYCKAFGALAAVDARRGMVKP